MIRNILAATVAVAAALVFTGTAHADVTIGDPNVIAYELAGTPAANAYLLGVRTHISAFHAMADDHSTLTVGVTICQAFARGVTVAQMASAGLQNGFTPFETGVQMGGATAQLCPEYAPVMMAELTAASN